MTRLLAALALLTVAMSSCACEDRAGAEQTLRSLGFKEVHLGAPKVFSGCGKEDMANNPFTARNAAGEMVSGVVCCGGPLSFKGCTVRF